MPERAMREVCGLEESVSGLWTGRKSSSLRCRFPNRVIPNVPDRDRTRLGSAQEQPRSHARAASRKLVNVS